MSLKKENIFIQSRGVKQQYDYRWKDLENKLSEEAEKTYQDICCYLYHSEIKSLLIAKQNESFCLLITEIDSKKNESFSKTPIRINLLVISEDELDIRNIALFYIEQQDKFKKALLEIIEFNDDFSIEESCVDKFLKQINEEGILSDFKNNSFEKPGYKYREIEIKEIKNFLKEKSLPTNIYTTWFNKGEAISSIKSDKFLLAMKKGINEFIRTTKSSIGSEENFPIYVISEQINDEKLKRYGIWFYCKFEFV